MKKREGKPAARAVAADYQPGRIDVAVGRLDQLGIGRRIEGAGAKVISGGKK